MDKEVLIQYCELMEEIKDIRRRIRELDKFLENPPIVADTVKGAGGFNDRPDQGQWFSRSDAV